jgi:hypothetical protein
MVDKRSNPREPARAKVRVLVDEQWHDGVITNISAAGVRLYLRLNVETGKVVHLEIAEFGQYNAMVVWCVGDETGLVFDHDPAEITNLLVALVS